MDRPMPPEKQRPGGGAAATDDQLQAELRRLRAENRTLIRLNRLQERFVAMASHEFKTPLTSITAYTDALLARADLQEPPRTRDFLVVIRDEAARLLRMVNRILDFSRMEYGSRLLDRQPTDLASLAQETAQSLAASTAAKRQRLELDIATDVPPAEVDADLLRQVLVNLLGNAVKFTPAGGHIAVTVREEAAGVAVDVADDGPGVPLEELRRIFREFYRAEGAASAAAGTGLGLSIVRHIVSLHGGRVAVRCRAAGGSVFTFSVPKVVHIGTPQVPGGVARPLMSTLVRLLAEFAESRAVVLLLPSDPDGNGDPEAPPAPSAAAALTPAAWCGIAGRSTLPARVAGVAASDPEAARSLARALALPVQGAHDWIAAPVAGGTQGWLLFGRRLESRSYGDLDQAQALVLGRLTRQALRGGAREPERTVEALRLLTQVRWRGVPTATAEALDLVGALAVRLGMAPAAAARLQDAAALHDAGMARVDDEILHGEGDLDWDARDEIDRHVELGLDLLAPLLPDEETAAVVRHHHERFDGLGHPDGLVGEAIPLGARALAVVDAWYSLTRERPYRAGLDAGAALAEISRCGGTQFDPAVVDAFRAVIAAAGREHEPSEAGSGAGPGS